MQLIKVNKLNRLNKRNKIPVKNWNNVVDRLPHGLCYSHFDKEVHKEAISIRQRGFINDFSKVNSIGQWGKILMMAMGIEDHLGHCRSVENQSFGSHNLVSCLNVGH